MNLNDRKIKELYKAHAEQTAPDMDALWERIEQGLDEKNADTVSGVTSKPVRKHIGFGKIAVPAALAAVIAFMIVPAAFRGFKGSDMAYDSENSIMGIQNSAEAEADAGGASEDGFDGGGYSDEIGENDAVGTIPTTTVTSLGTVRYEDLKLEPVGEYDDAAEAAPSAKTSGDDFFVEANVLIHTDMIVNAYVDRVYSRGETVCYVLTAENADTNETENITLESATPYRLLENRSYVLPLKFDGGTYSLVFENAPQIEVTLDGGLIFHNGWVTLDGEDSADVIYPQNGIDDFFYDRMKFSYSADTDALVKKWHELKGDDR